MEKVRTQKGVCGGIKVIGFDSWECKIIIRNMQEMFNAIAIHVWKIIAMMYILKQECHIDGICRHDASPRVIQIQERRLPKARKRRSVKYDRRTSKKYIESSIETKRIYTSLRPYRTRPSRRAGLIVNDESRVRTRRQQERQFLPLYFGTNISISFGMFW